MQPNGHGTAHRMALEDAAARAEIVRLWREPLEGPSASLRGYVCDLGSDLACILAIDHRVTFDGFEIVRIQDVSAVEAPCSQGAFLERALRLRGESVERAPDVRLSSMADALASLSELVPIVAVHRESAQPDTCSIGRPVRVDAQRLLLLEIDPIAQWAATPTEIDCAEITRISFGGGYEQALLLVGGPGRVRTSDGNDR